MNVLGNIFGGGNSIAVPSTNPAASVPTQTNQVPGGAGRNTGIMLAQVPNNNPALQPAQAPQAQSLEAQIKSLFAQLDPTKGLNLLMELMSPFMGMLGMGPAPATATAPAATQTEQTSAPQTQDPQTLQAIDEVMAQLGQEQTPQTQIPQTQDPQTLKAIDKVMAQLGQGPAQQTQKDTPASTDKGFTAMLEDLLANQMNQSPNNSKPKDSQSDQTVRLAPQNANKPTQTQVLTLAA